MDESLRSTGSSFSRCRALLRQGFGGHPSPSGTNGLPSVARLFRRRTRCRALRVRSTNARGDANIVPRKYNDGARLRLQLRRGSLPLRVRSIDAKGDANIVPRKYNDGARLRLQLRRGSLPLRVRSIDAKGDANIVPRKYNDGALLRQGFGGHPSPSGTNGLPSVARLRRAKDGGRNRTRICDLHDVNVAL